MKIKLVNLIEGVVITNPPPVFGTPTNSYRQPAVPSAVPAVPSAVPATAQPAKPFNPAQPFGQPVIPSAPKSSGVYSPTPAPPPGIAAPTAQPTTGSGSFILDNPPTTPTPQKPLPAGEAPEMLRPNFNPAQPFGQPLIPALPAAKPGAEYSPTPGGVKPKNPTVVQVPPAPVNTPKEPGMSQEDMERDADKWAQQNQKPAATNVPAATQSEKPKTKSQYEVNREASDKAREQTIEFQQRKAEKARAITAANQAEAERWESEAALIRSKKGGSGRGGRGRGGSGIFEQRALQFKPGALKTLLHLQEGGVGDAAAATWNFAKDYASDVYNQGIGTATKKAIGKVAGAATKGVEDLTGTEYFTKGAIRPNVASREFVKMTKEVPGDTVLNVARNLARYSPLTLSRMQAGRYARAAAFDPSEAEESISHYAKIHAMTNPLTYATGYAGKVASGIQAISGLAPAVGTAIGSAVGGPVGAGAGKLTGAALGLAASVGAGLAANVANKIVAPNIAAQAREAGRLDAARLKDWRYATL